MSLASEISPHLPFLRRFARAMLGSQRRGDAVVRSVLERAMDDPDTLSRHSDVRTALYAIFHEVVLYRPEDLADPHTQIASFDDDPLHGAEEITQRRLQRVTSESREALLLTSLEGFSSEQSAMIMGIDAGTVDELVATALEEIENQTRAKVLIVDADASFSKDLKSIIEDLGHQVIGIATTKREALGMASPDVGLILTDVVLADGMSGVDAIREILARQHVPVIFITEFPEELLREDRPEPAFLITKPYQRSTVKAAIAQALFFDAATVPDQDPAEFEEPSEPQQPLLPPPLPRNRQLAPRPGPIAGQVSDGRLTAGPSLPGQTVLEPSEIEAVRQLHRETACRLAEELTQSNVGSAAVSRIIAIAGTLDQPLDAPRSVRLGVQIAGLEKLLPSIEEVLDDGKYLDVRIFIDDLSDLSRQFPAYRTFVEEARASLPLTQGTKRAILAAVTEIVEQPDEVVAPDLKEGLDQLARQHNDAANDVVSFALQRTVGNILRAIGRWLKTRGSNLGHGINKAVDKALLGLLVGGGVAAAAVALAAAYPAEFSWLPALVSYAESILG